MCLPHGARPTQSPPKGMRNALTIMFRIKKLDLFIARQFGQLFAGTFFISLFVLMMQFLWRFVDELIGKGLSMDVLGQFFWYMALIMVPQALPLAILLSSLITFGNLGESSELTAIKAAGISLLQSMRGLIVVSVLIAFVSFYFQNDIAPHAQLKLSQLMLSMKQKSPELEIPEGVFYDGIPQTNIYVGKKDMKTGKLYNIMIYRMTSSYEDQAIILADSGMLQSTAEKKHLIMNLYSGEWFENMRSEELSGSASVPYRRETFVHKRLIMDFDGDFNLTEAAGIAGNARTKSLRQIKADIDSLNQSYDSIGRMYYNDARNFYYAAKPLGPNQTKQARAKAAEETTNIDTLYARLQPDARRAVVDRALSTVQTQLSDLQFKSMITSDADKNIRQHEIEYINKFTLSLVCIIFFFIGAPLGAIIRKGGLGVPIIVAVVVYIIFYILDNTGYRMARQGSWAIWFGKGLSPAVLIPTAIFITYKANKDSAVFNIDAYRLFFMRLLGLRIHRHIGSKEVIIHTPDYTGDAETLRGMSTRIAAYAAHHNLKSPPNFIKVFFQYRPDHEIEAISEDLERVIEDLGNTRNRVILSALNRYPVLAVKAHTRPFDRRWQNVLAAIIIPAGLFLYCRMWGFRLRLYRDLQAIRTANDMITGEVEKMTSKDNASTTIPS